MTAETRVRAGVLRDTSDLRRRQRALYGDRGFAETNGGRRRYRTQSTRQVARGDSRRGGGETGKGSKDDGSQDDMPVSAAVQLDLDHMSKPSPPKSSAQAAAAAAAAAAKAVRADPESSASQANAQEAAGADAAYSPGGAVHPHRARAAAAAAQAAAEEDKKQRRKIERDAAIVGAFDKAPTTDLAGVLCGEGLEAPRVGSSVGAHLGGKAAQALR